VPASDNESIRWSTRFGEGSTRSEKVQGEFASSALKRCRSQRCAAYRSVEAGEANRFIDRSSFLTTRMAGIAVRAPAIRRRRWRSEATAS
jgi:hypothetical protein